jgi:hypothetical protein
MKIQKNVNVPRNIGRNKMGEVSLALIEFVESEDTNMKFECGGKAEADRVYSTLSTRMRASNLPVKVMRSMNDIYVIRKEDK